MPLHDNGRYGLNLQHEIVVCLSVKNWSVSADPIRLVFCRGLGTAFIQLVLLAGIMSDDKVSVTVRAIQESDYENWLPLWLAYQDFYETELSEDTTRTTFKRFLDPSEPVFSAVAVQDNRLIGFVNAVTHRSTWSVANSCYLEDLYVDPTIRGNGAGKRLIEWVQKFAQQSQCARLYWHTHETNKRAQKLYNWVAQNSGFIEYRMTL